MRRSADNASAQLVGCQQVGEIARPTHEEFSRVQANNDQDKLVSLGADMLAMDAMRRFPEDVGLLMACMSALSALAQWNAGLYGPMGDRGAVEVMAEALKHHSDKPEILAAAGSMGSFTDFPDPGALRNLDRTAKAHVT